MNSRWVVRRRIQLSVQHGIRMILGELRAELQVARLRLWRLIWHLWHLDPIPADRYESQHHFVELSDSSPLTDESQDMDLWLWVRRLIVLVLLLKIRKMRRLSLGLLLDMTT